MPLPIAGRTVRAASLAVRTPSYTRFIHRPSSSMHQVFQRHQVEMRVKRPPMEMDRDAFTKITEALKYQADRLIDLQFDLFALAAAIKNQVSTDQASFEQDFRAVRLVLGKGR